jgi:predicted NodU family carbamoyl transferase
VETYYELDKSEVEQQPYSFMLSTVKVREKYREKLEAITHLDNTARLQVVSKETNERFHKLISSFGDKTGIYTLLNTSFNRRGEPIVSSPEDAIATFNWTGIDILVMNNFIINKK